MSTSRLQLANPNRVELTQLEFDRRLVWACRFTPETAIAAIGLRRVLEAIGIDEVVEFCIEEYGIERVVELVLEKHWPRAGEIVDPSPAGVLPPPTPRAE